MGGAVDDVALLRWQEVKSGKRRVSAFLNQSNAKTGKREERIRMLTSLKLGNWSATLAC